MAFGAVLFDYSGVVADDTHRLRDALVAALWQEVGIALSHLEYRELLGRTDCEALASLLARRGRPAGPEALGALVARRDAIYRESDPLAAVPGIDELTAACSESGARLAIVSAAPRARVEAGLAAIGLAGRFAQIVALEDSERGRPDPAPYQIALARLAAAGTLAVEHSYAGIAAARAAGLVTLAITTTAPMHMLQRRAHWVVDHFCQVDLAALVRASERPGVLRR
jgi:beta-phosphoglucomutase